MNSSFQLIQKGSPLSPIHIVDSFVVDIVLPSFSHEESDPLKFISTESLPDSNGSNLHGCIWTLPNTTSSATNPKNFFRLYKSFCLFDHRCEKIIALAIFVNFYDFSKFLNLAFYLPHGRAIAKNGASWPVM